jgi:hypothetical protein
LLDATQHRDEFAEFAPHYDWTVLRVAIAIRHILIIRKSRKPSTGTTLALCISRGALRDGGANPGGLTKLLGRFLTTTLTTYCRRKSP